MATSYTAVCPGCGLRGCNHAYNCPFDPSDRTPEGVFRREQALKLLRYGDEATDEILDEPPQKPFWERDQ